MKQLSLARATLWGLGIAFVLFVIGNLADNSELLRWMRNAKPPEFMGYLFAQLVWLAVLFVLVAFIRNWFVAKTPLRTKELSEEEFNKHTNKILNAAAGDGVIPKDAICATAKALGVLVTFIARRENANYDELLAFAQKAVGEFSRGSEQFMRDHGGLWSKY